MSELTAAAQLFTLREYLQTPEDINKNLKKVKDMGYNAVQVSGIGPIEPEELKKIVNKYDLKICATHVSFDALKNDLEAEVEKHKLWDCKYVGVGSMPGEYRQGKDGYIRFAREASEIGRELKKNDLQFIYHNHNFEFVKYDGKTGLQILYEESDPEVFDFEIDTYWIQAGGASPVKWIEKMEDRMKVVHFKDMVMDGRDQIMAEVGEGNLDWDGIVKVCKDIGVKWCVVEQDTCQRIPFESLEISLNNIKKWEIKA